MLLDGCSSFEQAEGVVAHAISEAPRAELLQFMGELYADFIGEDPTGGSAGTLEHIKRLNRFLGPSIEEFNSVGIDPLRFAAILKHH
jgi:hypothetical protein